MNFQVTTFIDFVLLLLLARFTSIHAVNTTCSQVFIDTTNGTDSFYTHSQLFPSGVTQNDVEAFRYNCANKKIFSIIEGEKAVSLT